MSIHYKKGDHLSIAQWPGEDNIACIFIPTGDTFLLNPVSKIILQWLEESGSIQREELIQKIADWLDVSLDDAEINQNIRMTLLQLHKFQVIEPISV